MAARLPDIGALGERPTPQPAGGVVSYNPNTGTETAPGLALVQSGAGIQNESDRLFARMEVERDKADTLRAEDAWNQYKEKALELSVGEKGFSRKMGGDAINGNIYEDYTAQLKDARQQIFGTLKTDEQRQRFDARAASTDLQFKHHVLNHYTSEMPKYQQAVFEGSVAAASAMVAAAPTDPVIFKTALLNLERAADQLADSKGIRDQGAIDGIKNTVRDGLIAKRIDALLYDNAPAAEALLRLVNKDITNPELKLKLQNQVTEAATIVRSAGESNRIIAQVRAEQPTTLVASTTPTKPTFSLVNAVIRTESGGRVDAVGPQNYTGEQAIGLMQVKPSTAKAVAGRLGIPFDAQRLKTDGAYNTRLGTAYLEEQLDRFGGNQTLALAAYNAGPEAVQDWIDGTNKTGKNASKLKLGNPNTGETSAEAFAAKIPFKETREYVAKINGASPPPETLPPNTSGLPNSRDVRAQLPLMLARVTESADAIYGKGTVSPPRIAYENKLTSEINAKVGSDVRQLEGIQRQAQGTLIDAVAGFNGKPKITSESQIQADPQLMRQWQLMDPQAKHSLSILIAQNATAATKEGKPENEQLFWKQWNRIHLDPGHPDKIDFYQQILQYAGPDGLNTRQIGLLRQEIDRNETPGGRSVSQLYKGSAGKAENYFKTHMMFTSQPERQSSAVIRWQENAGIKIDEYVKAGKDLRTLFQIDTPDSLLGPMTKDGKMAHLETYVNSTPAQGLAEAAGKVRAAGPQQAPSFTPEQLAALPQAPQGLAKDAAVAWMQALPANVTHFVDAGVLRMIPGRTLVKDDQGSVSRADTPQAASPGLGEGLAGQGIDLVRDAAQKAAGFAGGVVDRVTAGTAKKAEGTGEPELVDEKPRRGTRGAGAAGGMTEEQLARRDAITTGITEGVGGAAKAVVTAPYKLGQNIQEALRELASGVKTEPERLASAFRDLVKSGKYTVSTEPLIREALEGGLLSDQEKAYAASMLAKIEAKRR